MTLGKTVSWIGFGVAFLFLVSVAAFAGSSTILNASYDVSRELYKEINPAFIADWKKSSGADVQIKQSHGGSTKQAQAVAEGLEADVVTLNQPTDLDFLAKSGVIANDWLANSRMAQRLTLRRRSFSFAKAIRKASRTGTIL